MGTTYFDIHDKLIASLQDLFLSIYGALQRILAVQGSVGRGTPLPDSDVDLLLVSDDLPQGRRTRLQEFEAVDLLKEEALRRARGQGVHTRVSPILKTPEELIQGSLLDLDMIEEARILIDTDGMFQRHLNALAARLRAMGARKVRKGGYYWALKPDYRWGDRITL